MYKIMSKTGIALFGVVAAICIMTASAVRAATINGDGTVTAEGGLIWLQDGTCLGSLPWSEAASAVKNLRHGLCGLRDGSKAGEWRLPEEYDLRWRMGNTREFKVNNGYYWTSDTGGVGNGHVMVGMGYGGVKLGVNKYPHYVWAVRDPK